MAKGICSVDGCESPARSSAGYCVKHNHRFLRHGDPLGGGPPHSRTPVPCSYEMCERRATAKGLCQCHWRQQHEGRPLTPIKVRTPSLRDRLCQSREIDAVTGCWNWTGYLAKDGSGRTREAADQPTRVVYRLAYVAWIGPLAKGEVVHHTCANRACFNPEHLQAATQRENMLEMLERKSLKARIAFLEARVKELEGMLDASSQSLPGAPVACSSG